jgi:signal transduction histidine kinase
MSSRKSSNVRTKVVALLVSLAALWAFAAFVTVREGLNLLWLTTLDDNVGAPSEAVLYALQRERRLSVVYLGGRRAEQRDALNAQRAQTDQVVAEYDRLASASAVQFAASPTAEHWINETFTRLDKLAESRTAIDAGRVDRTQAAAMFTNVLDSIFQMYDSLGELDDKETSQDARTLTSLFRAQEVLAQEDALLAGVLAAGAFYGTEHADFIRLVGAQRFLFTEVTAELPTADRARYDQMVGQQPYTRYRALENRVVEQGRAGESLPVTANEWTAATEPVFAELLNLQAAGTQDLVDRSIPVAIGVVVRLALAGVLGLIAVIASIVISITTARRLVRQLERLRNAARDLASYRLPRVVERIQHGESVDVETEAPRLEFGRDEIGQVGEAFNQVQETAIRVAVEQAELRRSVRDVFLSLARRSQALLHRQLGLLDAMERRATDSEQLAELFRVDHLATRMRRNAENLIVLSGATAGRAWRRPVPMVDVLRGALAEVEDYTRVTVLPVGSASLLGRSVGDVIHLLAELIENAVSFSPPQTLVRVGGSVVGYGFAIEIEDRGLGMSPDELATANEQLRNPPEFRLTSTARLGLYVVGKLAERHGIRVRLTESPYGGTTAIVLLPGTLMAEDGAGDGGRPDTSQLDGYRPAQLAGVGRHRLPSDTGRDRAGSGPAETAGALALEAPVREINGAGREVPLFQEMPEPVRPVAPVAPVVPTAGPATPTAGPATPTAGPAALPTRPVPPAKAPLEPSRATEPPKLTPSGLPWRQRQSSPGEPPPRTRLAGGAAEATGGWATIAGAPDATGQAGATDGGMGNAQGTRGPDQTRSLMASYRSGTLRGRTEAARLAGSAPQTPEWTDAESPEPESPEPEQPNRAEVEDAASPPPEPAQPPPDTSEPPIPPAPQWTQSTPEMRKTEEGG